MIEDAKYRITTEDGLVRATTETYLEAWDWIKDNRGIKAVRNGTTENSVIFTTKFDSILYVDLIT